MRLIDADALKQAIATIMPSRVEVSLIIDDQPTIPYDMKWNPDCEDCWPEGINDCIECHKRQEGR